MSEKKDIELDPLIQERLSEKAVILEGYNDCIIGIGSIFPHSYSVLIYDVGKIIDSLVKKDGMSFEEAEEFFAYNIAGLFDGPGTPILMSDTIIDGSIQMAPLEESSGES
tara:strand:- start:693 stop:1022 length:330 start_codon:yes stop_codon:yes gene_type:complete